jgi:hypothetical protein
LKASRKVEPLKEVLNDKAVLPLINPKKLVAAESMTPLTTEKLFSNTPAARASMGAGGNPSALGKEVMVTAVAAKMPSPSGNSMVPSTVPGTAPSTLLKEKLKTAALAALADPTTERAIDAANPEVKDFSFIVGIPPLIIVVKVTRVF